jgi:hypothetical protein
MTPAMTTSVLELAHRTDLTPPVEREEGERNAYRWFHRSRR